VYQVTTEGEWTKPRAVEAFGNQDTTEGMDDEFRLPALLSSEGPFSDATTGLETEGISLGASACLTAGALASFSFGCEVFWGGSAFGGGGAVADSFSGDSFGFAGAGLPSGSFG